MGRIITAAVVGKAAVVTIATGLLDIVFWKQVIVVALSATITGLFGIVVAYVTSRDKRELHDRLDRLESRAEDVAGAVGATKRSTDPVPRPDTVSGDGS